MQLGNVYLRIFVDHLRTSTLDLDALPVLELIWYHITCFPT